MASPTDVTPRPTGTSRWVEAGIALIAGVVLSGCGAAADVAVPVDRPGGFSADSWMDAATAAQDARPAMTDRRVITTTRNGISHAVLGVDGSGRLLVSRITGRSAEHPLGTPHVGWLDHDGFEPLPYEDSDSVGHQVTAADHDGDDVVWVESTSTEPYLFDWTVWSSSDDARRQVDASDRLGPADQQHRVFGMTEPVVSGARVAWAADVEGSETPSASVLEAGTRGSTSAAEETEGATLPALVGDTLYAVRSPRSGACRSKLKAGSGANRKVPNASPCCTRCRNQHQPTPKPRVQSTAQRDEPAKTQKPTRWGRGSGRGSGRAGGRRRPGSPRSGWA